MHIIEIILDGFKSYRTRTVIKDFDRHFNAITGLNGSGKSNILDSILFVLGINNNWELLRVKNANELIYKNSQAGITKAEATIKFDNSNEELSPSGYEKSPIISVTRIQTKEKAKFYINGNKSTLNQIKQMFRSVQLNIDNPHFLVAQGKITTVINLSPHELVASLEEAAGTAYYNEKKKSTLAILKSKQLKLNNISQEIQNEIEPKLQKMKDEKDLYNQFQANQNELLETQKVYTAFKYYYLQNMIQNNKNQYEQTKENFEIINNELEYIDKDLENIKTKISENTIDKDSEENKQLELFEDQYRTSTIELKKQEHQNKCNQKKLTATDENIRNLYKNIQNNQNQVERNTQTRDFENQQLQQLQKQLTNKQNDLLEVNSYNNSDKNELIDRIKIQLDNAKQQLKQNQNDLQKNNINVKHKQEQIQQVSKSLQEHQKIQEQNTININKLQAEIKTMNIKINSYNLDEKVLLQLRDKRKEIVNKIESFQGQLGELQKNSGYIGYLLGEVKYRSPQTNDGTQFNRKKVMGRVFQLVKIDPKYHKPIEAYCFGKLKNIIIDNNETGKLLLRQKCFSERVDLLPERDVKFYSLTKSEIERAENIAKRYNGKATPGIEVVQYDQSIRNSVQHCFGRFFIVSHKEIAKLITQDLRIDCVNMEGDVSKANGQVSGGYVDKKSSMLQKWSIYNEFYEKRKSARQDIAQVEEQIVNIQRQIEEYNRMKYKNQQNENELQQLQQNQQNDSIEGKYDDIKKQIENLQVQKNQLNNMQEQYQKEVQDLQTQLEKTNKGNVQNLLKEQKNQLKQDISKLNELINKNNNNIVKIDLKIKNNQEQIQSSQEELQQEEQNRIKFIQDIQTLAELLLDLKNKQETIEKQKTKLEVQIASLNQNFRHLSQEYEQKEKKKIDLDKKIKKQQQFLSNFQRQNTQYQQQLKEMEDKQEIQSILEDKEKFGQEDTEYSFIDFDQVKVNERIQQLKDEQQKLHKRINFSAIGLSDNLQKKYEQLQKDFQTILSDKSNLEEDIRECEIKREESLQKCFQKVSEDFAQIFKSLLPGAQAKLYADQGKIENGIEMTVGFGNKWKQSLGELSGGQRSLLALSYILSLLKYQPAPFYILDEIDSALDVSHTENIGEMISQNFQQSQFVLISLKDGMYKNANVLYQIKFEDGDSKVIRRAFKKNKNKNNQSVLNNIDENLKNSQEVEN